MKYTARYKGHGKWFWKTYKNVVGDFLPQDLPGFRVLILEDESRVELPMAGALIEWSRERFLTIKKNMEREAGQIIPVQEHG